MEPSSLCQLLVHSYLALQSARVTAGPASTDAQGSQTNKRAELTALEADELQITALLYVRK